VITAAAYLEAMQHAGLRDRLAGSTSQAPVDDPLALAALAEALGKEIRDVDLPAGLARTVLAAYRQLGGGPVAVRSSATSEDASDTSFAGMNETFTDVASETELLDRIRACWASLFGARVLAYRVTRHMTDEPAIAVVVRPDDRGPDPGGDRERFRAGRGRRGGPGGARSLRPGQAGSAPAGDAHRLQGVPHRPRPGRP
jgi:pyruvate,water dikinase